MISVGISANTMCESHINDIKTTKKCRDFLASLLAVQLQLIIKIYFNCLINTAWQFKNIAKSENDPSELNTKKS